MPGSNEEPIAAIVGLGNPGKQYEATRHNVGFRIVDELARSYGITLQERKFRASWGDGMIAGCKVLLVKPLTFMNRSGEPVGEIARYFGLQCSGILVVHDDLDLPLGRIRLARRGGAGGHRGVSSIIDHLGCQDFPRLKLGIGRPLHREPVEAFVLQQFYAPDITIAEEMLAQGVVVAREVISQGLSDSMNRFNKREPMPPGPDQGQGS